MVECLLECARSKITQDCEGIFKKKVNGIEREGRGEKKKGGEGGRNACLGTVKYGYNPSNQETDAG